MLIRIIRISAKGRVVPPKKIKHKRQQQMSQVNMWGSSQKQAEQEVQRQLLIDVSQSRQIFNNKYAQIQGDLLLALQWLVNSTYNKQEKYKTHNSARYGVNNKRIETELRDLTRFYSRRRKRRKVI